MKSRKGNWGELFNEDEFDYPLEMVDEAGDGVLFLEEAHEALNKLSQKTNKRGKLMKQPRRAESWH